jgi:phage-related protein
MTWTIELFEDDDGRQPVREWILDLDASKRASAIAAIETVLTRFGLDVCSTEYGKQLGEGLFELRIRHDAGVLRRRFGEDADDEAPSRVGGEVLLRVFCHAYGDKIILLLGAYDKGVSPAPRRQSREIEQARKRLRLFKLRQKRERTGRQRRNQ